MIRSFQFGAENANRRGTGGRRRFPPSRLSSSPRHAASQRRLLIGRCYLLFAISQSLYSPGPNCCRSRSLYHDLEVVSSETCIEFDILVQHRKSDSYVQKTLASVNQFIPQQRTCNSKEEDTHIRAYHYAPPPVHCSEITVTDATRRRRHCLVQAFCIRTGNGILLSIAC